MARLRMLLRRPRELLPPRLVVRNLELDPGQARVRRAGREVNLTTKEFALLEFFMRNAGQIVDRAQILGRLWDAEFDSFSNVVEVHVENLRKKIGDGRSEPLLEAVRGLGYRLTN